MKIVCICGSPKGDTSVTMQYLKYIEMNFSQHEFEFIHVAKYIKRLEKNNEYFDSIIELLGKADMIMWAFPLYILHVHGSYKRFIELIFERKKQYAFKGKYAVSFSTSINFYDSMAHNYIDAISNDLGMHFIDFFSAHMNMLNKKTGQKKILDFTKNAFDSAEAKIVPARHYGRIDNIAKGFTGVEPPQRLFTDKRIVIIADKKGISVDPMVEYFRKCFSSKTELYYLEDIDIKGGCRGCLKCGPNNECFYNGKDGYKDFYDKNLIGSDILIFAGDVIDRFFSSKWKSFFDRRFLYTHRKTLIGKQVGFLISGPFRRLPDLKEWIYSYFEVEYANLVDIVSDEGKMDETADMIFGLAKRSVLGAESGYVRPATFRGIAGTKIFRDEVYSGLKVVFKADHKDYKKTGVYDFPQKKPLRLAMMTIADWITSISFIQKRMFKDFPSFMIRPYQHIFSKKAGA